LRTIRAYEHPNKLTSSIGFVPQPGGQKRAGGGHCQRPAQIIAPLDVDDAGQLEALFAQIEQRWGKLDFVLHAIAFDFEKLPDDAAARALTGNVIFVDAGYHVMG